MIYVKSLANSAIAVSIVIGLSACGGGGGGDGSTSAGGGGGPASIPTQISWTAPTTYNDNTTPFNDLAKYRFYYGSSANTLQLVPELDLDDPDATSLTLENLTSQDIEVLSDLVRNNSTHWYAMTAVDSQGTESILSTPIQYVP